MPKEKARGELSFRPKFRVSYKELLGVPGVVEKLKFPHETDKNLGPRKEVWYEFHNGFGYDVERCIALGHQLANLVKEGFLKEYLEADQEEPKGEVALRGQAHEILVHGELNTISRGFSRGGSSASKREQYARAVMSLEARRPDHPLEPALCFTSYDLKDVVPHGDDQVVIFVVTVERKVHRVLIDQGNSIDMMFWSTFNSLQLSPDQLRSYNGCLIGFVGDQVEVLGYIELMTTFFYGTSSRTISIRYNVVNAFSTYNLLLGRPSLNRLGAVASMKHMVMKLPSSEGGIITIGFDQKTARKCYESSLKSKRGTYSIIVQAGEP